MTRKSRQYIQRHVMCYKNGGGAGGAGAKSGGGSAGGSGGNIPAEGKKIYDDYENAFRNYYPLSGKGDLGKITAEDESHFKSEVDGYRRNFGRNAYEISDERYRALRKTGMSHDDVVNEYARRFKKDIILGGRMARETEAKFKKSMEELAAKEAAKAAKRAAKK